MRRMVEIKAGEQVLYIGSYACTRHRADELADLQRMERLAYLCLAEVDFITGDYLGKIREAAVEVAKERRAEGLLLQAGCQCFLLSTDFDQLAGELEKELKIPVRVHEGCRLCDEEDRGDGGRHRDRGERRDRDGHRDREGRHCRENQGDHHGEGERRRARR